jgi:lipoate-protein ligase A
MKKLRVLISNTFDPWFNLATEDWIFRDMDPEFHILYLWRNQNTVVIGRFQNPWSECHTEKMEQDGIKLARRQSGGGAVFQDLGNTNFTFMSGKNDYKKEINNQIIINALAKFNIKSQASGRNDLVIEDSDGPKKFSGSAFKETKDRAFHHGTLLINANLGNLANYLNPSVKKLQSKGIASVRARVTNLVDINPKINHELLSRAIIEEFFEVHGTKCEIEILDNDSLYKIEVLKNYYEKLKDWNWRFGESPHFSHVFEEKFDWGHIEVHLEANKGIIEDIKIFSDSLHPEMIEYLTLNLLKTPYTISGVDASVDKTCQQLPMISDYLREFGEWFKRSIQ